MIITEAIKFIVNRQDNNLLTDSKKIMAYLKDLCSEYPKELKIFNRTLDDTILKRIFGNDRDNVKIARLKDEFEDQGLSGDWSDFIISSFAQVLNWNYEAKHNNIQETKQPEIQTKINYIEVSLDKNTLEQLGYEVNYENYNDAYQKTYIQKNGKTITEIDIPETYNKNGKDYKITKIDKYAFGGCESLINVNIPNSVKEIGQGAFLYCESLRNIIICDSVIKIEKGAFDGCKSLKNIDIPNNITEIENSVFAYCSSLTSITIPNSVKKIGIHAFGSCYSLENIKISDSVTIIEEDAFQACYSLKNVELSNNLKQIGEYTFSGCESLEYICIPESVIEIGKMCFCECKSLKSVRMSNNISIIKASTFRDCRALSNITMPEYLTKISFSAFKRCESLKNLQLPKTVKIIGEEAFKGCSSLDITIPKGVEIEENAFEGVQHLNYYW